MMKHSWVKKNVYKGLWRGVALVYLSMPVLALAADGETNRAGISIIGNRELPKAVTIVPWKNTQSGALPNRPVSSVLNDEIKPVDRDEFQRETYYYQLSVSD